MAQIEIELPNDLMARIQAVEEHSREIIGDAVYAGGKIAEDAIRIELREVLSSKHKNGTLINALGTSTPKVDRNGVVNVKAGFSENRPDGDSNGKIANIFEYGSSRQPARPFLAPARRKSQGRVENAIIKTFNEEVARL